MNGKAAFEHGGNVHAAWQEKGTQEEALLDFSANINPLGLAKSVRQAVLDSIELLVHYPEPNSSTLQSAVSSFYKIAEKYITIGNGAVEPIYIFCQMIRPRRVLVTAPTFSEYERAALAVGAVIEPLMLSEQEGFFIDPQKIIARLAAVDVIFITNPNNPTGTLLTTSELESIVAAAVETNTLVVIDESFVDFLPDGEQYSCKHLLTAYSNLVILHSLTKFYAIPGLRLGFMLANDELTQRLHLAKDPWNVNTLAQAAGIAVLQDAEYRKRSISYMAEAKLELYNALNALPGIKAYKPAANFILVNIGGTGFSAQKICQAAYVHNILLRDCSNYQGLSEEYIRVAVKQSAENARLVQVLDEIIRTGQGGF